MAVKKGILPKGILQFIKELQQELLKDGCYIPGYSNEDEKDLARKAVISCSSMLETADCNNVINGTSRKVKSGFQFIPYSFIKQLYLPVSTEFNTLFLQP